MRCVIRVAGSIALLAGCASMNPQTRDEFLKMTTSGAPFAMQDSYVAKGRFDDVVAVLKKRSGDCFNIDSSMERTSGGITTMKIRDEFRTSVKVVSTGKAELTTQYTTKGAITPQTVPPGGFYHRAIDIEKVSATSTRLTYYGSSFQVSKDVWKAVKDWSEGRSAECPGV